MHQNLFKVITYDNFFSVWIRQLNAIFKMECSPNMTDIRVDQEAESGWQLSAGDQPREVAGCTLYHRRQVPECHDP